MSIERFRLSSGLEISRAITGLWQIADLEKDGKTLDPATTAEFMVGYAEAGLTTFDMADHYGSAEIIAGTFNKNFPAGSKSTLLTKWVPKPGPVSREMVKSAVHERLKRLQAKQVALLQFHAWNFSHPAWLDALYFLQELKEEGLIHSLGVTNFNTAHLRIANSSGIDIVTNQVSYSLIDRRAGGQMADYCASNGIAILAYGTVLGGFLSSKWLGQPEPVGSALANWSLMKYKRFIDVAGGWERFQEVLQTLDEVAREIGTSIALLASKYQLNQKAVGAVIIGARLGENAHYQESVKLFDFTISESQGERIAKALDQLNPIPGDCGDEYRKPPYLTASGDLSHHVEEFPAPYATVKEENRVRAESGTIWETIAGYSRAVRVENRILVSGTTATHGSRAIGVGDPSAQTHFIIDKIQGSIESLGGRLEDVVRTRIFISQLDHWEAVSRAHGARFGEIKPANTMVEARLVGDEYLVEIEAEAIISPKSVPNSVQE
jgi:aryl-alcohol dehydrogenase-like predicted oxidoreductase/enamine deaminase RidA (YjgF/YER057c/UK114 family)